MNRPGLLIFDSDGVLIDSEVLACQAVADELTDLLCGLGLSFQGRAVAERFAGYTDAAIAKAVSAETGAALLEADSGARCVASNAAQHRLRRALEIVGLARFFPADALFSAEGVARAKPAPDLHLHAAAVMGFAPEDCLVIEDSVTGVAAAKAAGIAVVGLLAADHIAPGQAEALREKGAQEVFESVPALGAWLGY